MSGFTPLQDIKLQTVDFNWIKETTKISHLKRAIKLIQMDGNVYGDLKQACYQRIGQLDPTQKKVVIDNRMSNQDRQIISKELEQWENSIQQKQSTHKNHQIFQKQKHQLQEQFDVQNYFNQDSAKINKKKQAQNERNKGNQAIRSKDYQQAIKYYTKSISLDNQMYQSYGNRALSYIKIKQFQKALDDCQNALKINPKYVKAYHRKAKALIGLKNRVDAYTALQQALKIQPDNSQCLSDLKDLREQMNEQEKSKLQGQSKFKKIAIQEDSQQEEQIQQRK